MQFFLKNKQNPVDNYDFLFVHNYFHNRVFVWKSSYLFGKCGKTTDF